MEEKLGIITKKDLEVLSKQAFESANNKGFYPAKAIYDIEEDTPLKYPFYYITYTPPCDMFSKKPSEEWNKRSSIIGISDWLYIDDLFPKKGGKE